MRISISRAARWALPAALALFSQWAMALGLGNVTVQSYLNQPLRAEIDLITRPGEDLGELQVNLASAEDFALIGASRQAISVPLRFTVQADGTDPKILVSSTLPVKEPIVRLVVEVSWPSGRMLREYTLFLDPPTMPSAAPPPASPPVADQRGEPAPEPRSEPAATQEPATEAPPAEAVRESAAAVPEEGEYGPVQSGETLWRIASDWSRGTGLDVNQVMLAIQRNNPQAFINDNINLLKRGAILRMPRTEEVAAISPVAARDQVLEQDAALARDLPAPTAAVETPLVADASAAPEADAGDEPAAPEPQLEIVPPSESAGVDSAYGTESAEAGAEAGTSATALREELARAEEELIGERQENEYLRERIEELESRLSAVGEDPPGEGTVADPELAAMEDRLREERLAQGEGAESPDEAVEVVEPEPEVVTPAPAVPQVRADPVEETPWYGSVAVWVIGLLLVAAAIAGWIFSRREPGGSVVSTLGRSEDETVRGIKDEAEEILRVLEPGAAAAGPAAAGKPTEETPPVTERKPPASSEEAEVLDEESEDPEVRLDLARAYISMGDREAARVILDEVIQHGSEAQQAEARSMLREL